MEGPPSKHRNMAEEYRDYFHVDIDEVTKDLPKNKRKGPRGGVALPFPVKLYRMLQTTQKNGSSDIVSWQEHGRCFMLHQPAKFASDILPTVFAQSKLTSFQRQLNLYGFQRIIGGKDRGGYYHEMFLRGRPDIARVIVRTPVKGLSNSQSIVGDDPDLYSYPYCEDGKSKAKVAQDEPDSSTENKQKPSAETKKKRALAQPFDRLPSIPENRNPIQEARNGVADPFFAIFPQAMIANPMAGLPTAPMFPAFTHQTLPNPLTTLQLLATTNQQARQAFLSLTQASNPDDSTTEQLRRPRQL